MERPDNLLIDPVELEARDILLRMDVECCVLVNEECEYRSWFWFPQASVVELERIWLALEHYDGSSNFPSLALAFGQWIDREATPTHYDLWLDALYSSRCHFLELNSNDDSYLMTPSCEVLFHKGFTGDTGWWRKRLAGTRRWRQQQAVKRQSA